MSKYLNKIENGKRLAVLVDPDKLTKDLLLKLLDMFSFGAPDFILAGGSLLLEPIQDTISLIKKNSSIPVYIFPGDATQLSDEADGIFFLSLISGRNPEFLIGNHVIAAPRLHASGIEVISTGYILIENGHSTSVEYMSNTKPIPFGKTELAVATAMAGEMLGMKQIYLEAGSGAAKSVGIDMIRAISEKVSVPLVVGGGIRTAADARNAYEAGADMIVIGTQIEAYPEQISEFIQVRDQLSE